MIDPVEELKKVVVLSIGFFIKGMLQRNPSMDVFLRHIQLNLKFTWRML
jgi:hypothetical protein